MCGIVGYVGPRDAAPIIHQGLKRLEYRGYDSCGIATMDGGEVRIKKGAGMIDEVEKKLHLRELPGKIGIGHTRWATHGKVSEENAHPHTDCSGEIAIVHNGIISNYLELREGLSRRGHAIRSDTDTECIAHLIEEAYHGSLEEAVKAALGEVKGTYALLAISRKEPGVILCARNESPLVLGLGDGEIFVGSDVASFLRFTKEAVPLEDGEYSVLTEGGYVIKELATSREVKRGPIHLDWSDEMAEKEGYEHFMLKEISEQPMTIVGSLNVYPEYIDGLAARIGGVEKVYLAAAGTSLHAAMVAEYWFSQLCGKLVIAIDASELAGRGILDPKTLVVGITQSGETYDTLAAMKYAKGKGAEIAAVVNVVSSTATRLADHVVLQGSGIEISVCATKTFTSQLVILLRTALSLAKSQGRDVEAVERELLKAPKYVDEVIRQKEGIKTVAERYFDTPNYLYIGKGINLPSALEGALKFKEITYHHAEGMSGGLLKHGTISLIDERVRTVALIPAEGENKTRLISNIQEVKARGGVVIGIASGGPVEQCDASIVTPSCLELISPIVFAPVYQLLAYYTAVGLGRNVDRPRALAKSVTVE